LQYSDYGSCFSICNNTFDQTGATLPLATDGATVQCRIYHATVASSSVANAVTHCPHTSSSGGGVCGLQCDNYCYTAMRDGCSGLNNYKDTAECNAFCKEFPKGTAFDNSGNTVECRTYHWGVASTSAANAATHCTHGTPSGGGGICGTYCEVYCQLANYSCTGNLALYTTTSDCTTACNKIASTGNPGDTAGDSIQCRIYHLGVAGQSAANAAVHCPHGLTASAVCTASTGSGTGSGSATTGSAATIVLSFLGLLVVLFF
jgi:hypothetical protein